MQNTLFEEQTEVKAKNPGEFFRSLFKKYCHAIDMHYIVVRNLCKYEKESSPCAPYTSALSEISHHTVRKEKADLAKSIRDSLVVYATRVFSPDGALLSIDTHDLHSSRPIDEDNPHSFDPMLIWDYLKEKYGNGEGSNEAWRQVACKLIYSFNLKRDTQIQERGNYIILNHRVYIDSLDKKYDKKNRLHYNCRQEIHEVFANLASFALWCENRQLAADLKALSEHYLGYGARDYIESRAQFSCGTKAEIVLVTFTTNFEFRIQKETAEQLQCFIGQFGTFRDY